MDLPGPNESPLSPEEAALERDLLAMKLRAEFGMQDGFTHQDLPPEMELAFLKQIYDFEQHYSGAVPSKTFKESLEIPDFSEWPAGSLPWEEGERLVEEIISWYRKKNIEVVFTYSYPSDIKYAFLTKELPESPYFYEGTPMVQSVILYEDFHPNHNAEIERKATDFLDHFFNKNVEGFQEVLWREQLSPTHGPYDGQALLDYLDKWFAGITAFEDQEYHILETSYEISTTEPGDEDTGEETDEEFDEPFGMGYAEGLVRYIAHSLLQTEPIKVAGAFKLYFQYRAGHWAIFLPQFPGIPIPPEG